MNLLDMTYAVGSSAFIALLVGLLKLAFRRSKDEHGLKRDHAVSRREKKVPRREKKPTARVEGDSQLLEYNSQYINQAENVLNYASFAESPFTEGPLIYQSPDDFTAVSVDASSLRLSGLPFPPLFDNFVSVVEYDRDSNLITVHRIDHTKYDWTWAPATDKGEGVLTIDGATFADLSTFTVVLRGPHR